ncbi:MAG: ABC transporter permease [Rhodocyclaceae bacterium]|nr:ABC transporter permease [Rhodocyclaceae bacterium]
MRTFAFPCFSLRAIGVWRRNFLVWKKLAIPSMLGNLADPMIYMFGLGYGLGSMLPAVNGLPYIAFLAGGTLCASTMNAATFEALYSAFSRMHVQKTWEALLYAPLSLDDVVAGEWLWAASKSMLSGTAILGVITLLGFVHSPLALWVLPVVFLTGLAFAALGLIVNALSPSYDFFMYYFTLVITPMIFLSGVFFPLAQLPEVVQWVAHVLPLAHAVALVRPLLNGEVPAYALVHVAVLALIAITAFWIALGLTRRRLLG